MSDLISRQAAIRWVKTECNPYGKPTLDFESGKKGYRASGTDAIRTAGNHMV
jgi:hypothetical protein